MSEFKSEVDVAVIGAGAAGLAAGRTLQQRGADFLVLEASHRIGGRGYTEEVLPGQPFDLGCHWLHSASLNPFVAIADKLGITYSTEGFGRAAFENGSWLSDEEMAAWPVFYDRQEDAIEAAAAAGPGPFGVGRDGARGPLDPLFRLQSNPLHTSADCDQISVADLVAYNDTEENWAVRDGYGTLIARYGEDLPVTLNAPVTEIDWSGPRLRLTGPKGTVSARAAILTVSTGILAAGDIHFTPALPDRKAEAIAGLPLGSHNRICLAFDRDVFGPEARRFGIVRTGDSEPMAFNIRPFGFNYVVGVTGGRFADWLERAGPGSIRGLRNRAAAGRLRQRDHQTHGQADRDRLARGSLGQGSLLLRPAGPGPSTRAPGGVPGRQAALRRRSHLGRVLQHRARRLPDRHCRSRTGAFVRQTTFPGSLSQPGQEARILLGYSKV